MSENTKLIDFALKNKLYIIPFEEDSSIRGKVPLKNFRWIDYRDPRIEEEYKQILTLLEKNPNVSFLKNELNNNRNKLLGSYITYSFNRYLREYFASVKSGCTPSNPLDPSYRAYKFSIRHGTYAVKCDKSNLLVIDCDSENHNSSNVPEKMECFGLKNLMKWFYVKKLPLEILSGTLVVKTCSGGFHFIYRYSNNSIIKKVDFLNNIDLGGDLKSGIKKSVDLICGNNVFIAPYSLNKKYGTNARYLPIKMIFTGPDSYSTEVYEPEEPISNIREIDANLESALESISNKKTVDSFSISTNTPKYYSDSENKKARDIYRKNLEQLRQASIGQRHDELLRHCRNIFMFYRYLDESDLSIIQRLTDIAVNELGLKLHEVRTPLKDAMYYGLAHQKIIR